MECGDDGIINKWLVRWVSQGIPNLSTLVQKWSRLTQTGQEGGTSLLCHCYFIFEQSNFGSFTCCKFQVKVKIQLSTADWQRGWNKLSLLSRWYFLFVQSNFGLLTSSKFHVIVKIFWPYVWGKCLSRFKLKGKGWNEEEKKTVTKVTTLESESLRVNIINVSSYFSIFSKGCLTAL